MILVQGTDGIVEYLAGIARQTVAVVFADTAESPAAVAARQREEIAKRIESYRGKFLIEEIPAREKKLVG